MCLLERRETLDAPRNQRAGAANPFGGLGQLLHRLPTLAPSIFRCPTVFMRSSLTFAILLQPCEERKPVARHDCPNTASDTIPYFGRSPRQQAA